MLKEISIIDSRPGDRVAINGELFTIKHVSQEGVELRSSCGITQQCNKSFLLKVGSIVVRSTDEGAHPYGIIPDEATVVNIAGTVYQRLPWGRAWYAAGSEAGESTESLQLYADRYGFEELVPKVQVTDELLERAAEEAFFNDDTMDPDYEWSDMTGEWRGRYLDIARGVIEVMQRGK